MSTTQLPASVLTRSQKKMYGPRFYTEDGTKYRITATVRYDDECNNGYNSFAITGSIDRYSDGRWYGDAVGCIHEEIAKHFPELAPVIKWHLMNSDGPFGYIDNTVYHAGDRDCHGLLKGEFRPHTSRGQQNGGIAGVPNWVLEFPDNLQRDVYANKKPAPVTLEWRQYGRTGDGKERELDKAREAAIWPDATDEDLTAPGLEERLEARLPRLMDEFRAALTELGLTY